VQVGRAKLDSCEYDPLMRYKQAGAWSIAEPDDRLLITSWSELQKVARDMGLDASAAST
jgi:hypothetical protein